MTEVRGADDVKDVDGSTELEPDGSTGLELEGSTGLEPDDFTGLEPDGSTGLLEQGGSTGLEPDGSTGLEPDGSTGLEPDDPGDIGDGTDGDTECVATGCGDSLSTPSPASHKHGLHRLRRIVYDAPLKYSVLHGVRRLLHYASLQRTSLGRCASCGLRRKRKGKEESAEDACCGCTEEPIGQEVGWGDVRGAREGGRLILLTQLIKPNTSNTTEAVCLFLCKDFVQLSS